LPVEALLPDSRDTRTPTLAAIGLGLALVALVAGVAGWLLTRGEADQNGPATAVERAKEDAGASPSAGPAPERRPHTAPPQDPPGPTVVRPDANTFERTERTPDAAATASGEADVSEWVDPDNRRVLGRSEWMADLPDTQEQAIDQELDDSEPAQVYPPRMQMRRAGIDAAAEVVSDCFDGLRRRQPDARGRISVVFELRSGGGRAQLHEPSISRNIRLDDPAFESCVVDGLAGTTFASEEEASMRVEYPFFFE
jgi:hypothetical protein